MQDQHFMQQWNAGHDRFSEDFDRLARKLFAATGSGPRGGQRKDPGDKEDPGDRDADDKDKRPARQECALAHRAKLTGIGIIAGVLAGSTLAMVAPLVTAMDCPQHANQICVRAALA